MTGTLHGTLPRLYPTTLAAGPAGPADVPVLLAMADVPARVLDRLLDGAR